MLMQNKPTATTFLVLLLCYSALGYAQLLPFEQYSIKDGLPSNWITAIVQDARGYLWAGGDGGFAIYDGIRFTNYDVDKGLPVGFVWCFGESRKAPGTMYLGTNGGGLATFENGKITARLLRHGLPAKPGALHNTIHAIYEDDDGTVWCGTNVGIYQVRGDSVSFFFASGDSGIVQFFVPTRDGRLWFNAREKLYHYTAGTGAVKQVDLGEQSAPLVCLFEDADGIVWCGAEGGALYKIQQDRLAASKSTGAFDVGGIVEDHEGNLWVAAGGLLKIAKKNFPHSEFTRFTTANGLPDNVVGSCFLDREHNLWLSSRRGGLIKLSERSLTRLPFAGLASRPDVLNHTAVVDSAGHLFVATERGLWEIWRDDNGSWAIFLHVLPALAPRPEKRFFAHHTSVAFAPDGLLWHTIHGGGLAAYRVTRQPRQASRLALVRKLAPGRDLPDGNPLGITIDRRNRIWYVIWGLGIVQIDPVTLRSQSYLQTETPQAFIQDRQGRIWIGTFNDGIHVFEVAEDSLRRQRHFSVRQGLPSNRIRALLQRRNGEIWIGHRFDGISIYREGTFARLTSKDGLLHNAVWALAEDSEGRVWIGTSAGVQQTEAEDSRRLRANAHLIGRFTEGLGVIASEKTVWAMSADELILYEYGRTAPPSPPPPVYLTGMRVNGKEQPLQNGLQLSHDQNVCTILFTGISLTGANALRYTYRLAGLQEEWQEPIAERVVTYASLRPGNYTFEVKAVNAGGVESRVPAAISFKITPPFWQRWWFIAFCLIVLGSVLYGIHVVRLDRLVAIERIRARIATDLHDDIGAGLTHIGLLSQVALQKKNVRPFFAQDSDQALAAGELDLQTAAAAVHELGGAMERMGNVARELSAAMSDVVWSINPQHDSGEALQRRLSVFAHEICRARNIALHFEVAEQIAGIKLHPELRRSLLLIAKEALHNAVKYSGSPSLAIKFLLQGKNLVVEIVDAGKGIAATGTEKGNGLVNMRLRTEKLGGTFELISAPGKGTQIKALVPLKNLSGK